MVVKETMGTFNVQLSAFDFDVRRRQGQGAVRRSVTALVQDIGTTRGYKTWAPNVELRTLNFEL